MFDFLVRKNILKGAQRFIDRLNPSVVVHVPDDFPLLSVKSLKEQCVIVSKINSLEDMVSKLSDVELKTKTQNFKAGYLQAMAKEKEEVKQVEELYRQA